MTAQPTLWLAFVAGLLSFASPCVLPLFPSYISYISGVAYAGGGSHTLQDRMQALSHTFFFVMGFAVVFFALGLSASLIGRLFTDYRNVIRMAGGIVVIAMGVVLSGLYEPKWLMMERKWEYRRGRVSYLASLFVGVSFAAGWTPCIGPILSAILLLVAAQSAQGIPLILAYIVGFALPFFVLAGTLTSVRGLARYGSVISKVGGYLMIVMGILLVTNWIARITTWLIQLYGGVTIF
ncbi:cytochrome c biogenesis protein CcdA [Alicyclobacillaceae bacterium I2511]|nr:cytochrome c biogenesis protein CcdA [Alicyclobacillaceae bacterium I2511]